MEDQSCLCGISLSSADNELERFSQEAVGATTTSDMNPQFSLHSLPLQVCVPVLSLLTLLLLIKLTQCVRTQPFHGREKQVEGRLAKLIQKRCHLIDCLYVVKEEYMGMQTRLEGLWQQGPAKSDCNKVVINLVLTCNAPVQ